MYVVSFALAIPIRAPDELLDTVARSSDRSRSTKTIPRQPVAEDVTLATRSAEDRVQSGSADIQSLQHLDAVAPPRLIQDRKRGHNLRSTTTTLC